MPVARIVTPDGTIVTGIVVELDEEALADLIDLPQGERYATVQAGEPQP
jgi:hypothetical protein